MNESTLFASAIVALENFVERLEQTGLTFDDIAILVQRRAKNVKLTDIKTTLTAVKRLGMDLKTHNKN